MLTEAYFSCTKRSKLAYLNIVSRRRQALRVCLHSFLHSFTHSFIFLPHIPLISKIFASHSVMMATTAGRNRKEQNGFVQTRYAHFNQAS